MIFKNAPKLIGGTDIKRYLQADLFTWLKSVAAGLLQLDLAENFVSFRVNNIQFGANATVSIANQLQNIPTGRLIIKQVGNGLITDGVWNAQLLQMTNNSANPITASIIFYA